MKTFKLLRHEDVNGCSGTGIVAEGIVFTDGTVVMHWVTKTPSTSIYRSVEDLEYLHGHEGRTEVVYE